MSTESTQKKRGKLHHTEEEFIVSNVHSMSAEDIANSLNRTTDTIIKYMRDNNLISANHLETNDIARLKKLLHSRPYWREVNLQLSEEADEVEFFEHNWIEIMQQFREDVLYSEELNIKQWIILEVLMNRSMKERKSCQQEIDKIQTELSKLYLEDESSRDAQRIASLESQVTFCRGSMTNYTNEYTKLLNEVKFISKSLKANRDERIKRVDDGKNTFQALIRLLEDEKQRDILGDEAELMKLARAAAAKRMSQLHIYEDGKADQPLLTADTFDPKLYEDDNGKEEEESSN